MPYVKSIPIRSTVNRSIAYILNPEKTDGLLLASGINVVADRKLSYQQFKAVYQRFDALKHKQRNTKKKPILAHHFVQSFKAGEVTIDTAKKIAYEWANKVFGDNHQVVIATHNDKGHIHNHFIVNAYGFDGKKFYSNKTSLSRLRNLSDEISLNYGIRPISNNKNKSMHYKEWMERKRGNSWKHKVQMAIDDAILKSNDLDDLLRQLERDGFEIKRGKYISVRPQYLQRFVRTRTLGEDYTESRLIERINNKHLELPIIIKQQTISKQATKEKKGTTPYRYKGIQLKYVSLIRLIADLITNNKKPPRKYNSRKPYSVSNDYDVYRLADHLRFLNQSGIENAKQLIDKFEEVKITFSETKQNIDKMNELSERLEGIIKNAEIYFEFKDAKSISSRDKLKLSIAKSILGKYNIKQQEDLVKLTKELEKIKFEQSEIMEHYDILEKRYNKLKDIVTTYEKIEKNTYLKQSGIEEKER